MPMTIQALRTEIDTDPKSLGYATLKTQSNGPEAVAAKLNEAGASAETLFKAWTPLEDIVAGVVRADFDALAAAGKTYWDQVVTKVARVKTGDATYRAQIAALFPVGTTTRTNLTNIASRSASRAEALWGEEMQVSPQDVAAALEL